MPERNFTGDQLSQSEAANYSKPSNITQSITVGVSATAVTLNNPQSVTNADATGSVIAYKLRNDTAYATEYFSAGQTKVMDAISIGGSGDGTTAEKVIVRGVK